MTTRTGADVSTLGEDRQISGGRLWASRGVAGLLVLIRVPELATTTSTAEAAGMLFGILAVTYGAYWILLRVLSSATGDGTDGDGAAEAGDSDKPAA